MGTSEHSQATLFEDGSENEQERLPLTMWPTPRSQLAKHGAPSPSQINRFDRGDFRSLDVAAHVGLTSSPGGSRVNPSLSPGSSWARRMTGISGQRCSGSLPSSGPIASLLRTLLVSSAWGSTRCYLTWKRSATPAGRSLFLLRPSAPPTGGIGSGFLPTPAAQEPGIDADLLVDKHGEKPTHINQRLYHKDTGRVVQDGLTQFVKMWPTPRHEGFDAGSHRGTPDSLHAAVKLLPTPTARDWKDGSSVQNVPENGLLGRWSVNHSTTPGPGQKLSAAWVTRLQGYPDGWLDLE